MIHRDIYDVFYNGTKQQVEPNDRVSQVTTAQPSFSNLQFADREATLQPITAGDVVVGPKRFLGNGVQALPVPYDFQDNTSINAQSGFRFRTSSIETKSTVQPNRNHKMSTAISLRSFDDPNLLPPSSEEDKSKTFRSTLATIGSCMYAIFILTVGVLIFIADIFLETPLSEIYCLYLVLVGFVYIGFLLFDIRKYVNRAKKYFFEKAKFDEEVMMQNEIENMNEDAYKPMPVNENITKDTTVSVQAKPPEPPKHEYCFSHGRHAGSFYLKLGAAGFCMVHLVHSFLFLNIEIVYMASEQVTECGDVKVLLLFILYPIYSFCQLFFIFKYSNVIILKYKGLARFALMHCIGSNLCFWVWTITRETVESLKIYSRNSSDKYDYLLFSGRAEQYVNLSSIKDNNCSTIHEFNGLMENVFPYLYPFTIEYSILIVGIFYILWSNIGTCNKENETEYQNDLTHKDECGSYKSSNDEQCKPPTAIDENGMVSNLTINIDCHSSNKGWFGGLMVLVISVVSIVVSYVSIGSLDSAEFGVLLKESSEMALNLIMLVAVIVAYAQIKKLDVNPHPISQLDDLLLFICIPAFFMNASFTLVPAIMYENYVKIFLAVIVILQVLFQTPFIIDALRRCSNSRELRRKKPGRELVTFLIVCNVSTWIFETFSIKGANADDERYDFYGKVLWTVLGHVSVPLCMFYRFHSSVCLADIWKAAYVPGNKH